MKAFEEYREQVTSRELGCPDLVWKAALEWLQNARGPHIKDSVDFLIKQELEN